MLLGGDRDQRFGLVLTLRTEELSGDVDGLAADDDDLLSVQELLGDSAGKTTKEMALAVDDDLAGNVSLRNSRKVAEAMRGCGSTRRQAAVGLRRTTGSKVDMSRVVDGVVQRTVGVA